MTLAAEDRVLVVSGDESHLMLGEFDCLSCGHVLGELMTDGKWTYLRGHTAVEARGRIRRMEIDCPDCGEVRLFNSISEAGHRLGVDDG